MQPTFNIFADDKDITYHIEKFLTDLSVTDEAGFQSDSLTLTVDDPNGILSVPKKGVHLRVYLGYQETGVAYVGEFIIDEPELSGPPDQIVIRGRGADLRNNLKSSKTRSWDRILLGDIVKKIAGEHQLKPKVAIQLAQQFIEHIDQTHESDLHFLTRLAKEYDAISKPAAGDLLFTHRNQSKTVSNKDLPALVLKRSDVISYRLVLADRSDIGHVVAYWQDKNKAHRISETVGDKSKPGKTLRKTYMNANEARSAAKSELSALQRGCKKLDITIPGNPRVIAESPIVLSDGWREGFVGNYVAVRVEHRMGNSGYTTSVSAN
ncbi:contractile injection system protein, VgrG/Pvc8 family [Zooshikella sp. RANM57]|uniref:contractile injection system protein, VgrG/Pvc8 family n=1 Tax=Zooshikella sp. RANM57 TaxID=3425863 RepID=UPI003D6F141E